MSEKTRDNEDEGLGAETGMIADIGTAQPGSPADQMGMDVPPPSGGVGAMDVGEGGDLTGDDQQHDHGIVDEQPMTADDALKPRMTSDIDPTTSNISGPTKDDA